MLLFIKMTDVPFNNLLYGEELIWWGINYLFLCEFREEYCEAKVKGNKQEARNFTPIYKV